MKYIKRFDSKAQYESFIRSSEFVSPNVSIVFEDGEMNVAYNIENPIPNSENESLKPQLLTLTSLDDNTFFNIYYSVSISTSGSGSGSGDIKFTYDDENAYIEYSYDDGETWTLCDFYSSIYLNINESVKLRGNILRGLRFDINHGRIAASGDVTSLSNGIGGDFDNNFEYDFSYDNMFDGCTSLTTAPELPATTLANNCYNNMFYGCTSLTTAPELPATTLAYCCYAGMFYGCTSLTTAPELPATTLAEYCYDGMFWGCTSLTTAPELPATTLAERCYAGMFKYCTNLNYIKAMFTTTPSSAYTYDWVDRVSSTGTFIKNSAATWDVTGINGIPSGWTVQTVAA